MGPRLTMVLLLAAAPLSAARQADGVQVALQARDGGAYAVEGSFLVRASLPTAWSTLTDYEHIDEFVSSMQSSRVVADGQDGAITVEQQGKARFLMFARRFDLWLKVEEQPMRRITFVDVSKKDFEIYEGRWEVAATEAGIRVDYSLTAKPRFTAPGAVLRGKLRKTAEQLLQEVRQEMLRRTLAAATAGGPQ